MADIALVQRPSGKYDLLVNRGNVVRTGQLVPVGEERPCAIAPGLPALLRLLLQGEWIADDGERSGEGLNDVRLLDGRTKERVRQIVARRAAPLIPTYFTAVTVQDVRVEGTSLYVAVQYVSQGQQPRTVQLALKD